MSILDFPLQGNKRKLPDAAKASRHPARVVSLVCFTVNWALPNTPLTRP